MTTKRVKISGQPAEADSEEPVDKAAPVPEGDRAPRPIDFSDDVRQSEVSYEVVEHDGGWAYRVGETYSEAFPSRGEAVDAAARAAADHLQPGSDELIEYQDRDGIWRSELASGGDRPYARVEDANPIRPTSRSRVPAPRNAQTISRLVRRPPLLAVAIAAAVGFFLGSR